MNATFCHLFLPDMVFFTEQSSTICPVRRLSCFSTEVLSSLFLTKKLEAKNQVCETNDSQVTTLWSQNTNTDTMHCVQ